MTDVPNYEPTGPLSVCPCCGGLTMGDDCGPYSGCCLGCYESLYKRADDCGVYDMNTADARAWYASRGIELRAAGKLPPLTTREEQWGVWCEPEINGKRSPSWNAWAHGARGDEVFGTRDEAQRLAAEMSGNRPSCRYTVRPYPDAPKTEESEPLTQTVMARVEREQSAAPTPPVDPYAAHREANDSRRAKLTERIAKLEAEEAEWTRCLESIRADLAAARKEMGLR